MGEGPLRSLSFPDGPKLELDELIDQLVDRAQGVQRAQGRMRELLAAIEVVTGELGLDEVLRHVAEAARALVGARYAALGVIAHDSGLEQFIHTGMTDALVDRIGQLPQGKGLLGALITNPHPIRLTQIGADPRSVGFPDQHPQMGSFLGVPIRVGGEVFGNLYLTDAEAGQFSAEDEELVRALAVTAGTAISNARLYHQSQAQQRWLGASAEISAQLLTQSGEDPLQMIARRASEIADADLVTVALLTADGADAMIEFAVGDGADGLLGQRFPVAQTLVGKSIEDGAPLLLQSGQAGTDRVAHVGLVIDVGPVMVIPLIATGTILGALTIARAAGRSAFTPTDASMASGFASHASVALELAAARADQQRVALLEDRDRIARDLHDHVIQQLFAIGLSLESVAARVGANDPIAQKLHERVADIDRTIRQIRTSIFQLRSPLTGESEGFRQHVLAICGELRSTLGFAPRVAFSGSVDAVLDGELAEEVLACVREALTNVAKHAQASMADLEVTVDVTEVTVTIGDDGIGIRAPTRSSGLANLRARAEGRGGSFRVLNRSSGGTQLTWKAPIR